MRFNDKQTVLPASWRCVDSPLSPPPELTEGEEEGVEADLSPSRNLRDQPLCYAADGH